MHDCIRKAFGNSRLANTWIAAAVLAAAAAL
jgi:hypothetical protein